MILTVEIERGDNPEVAISFDSEGLNLLRSKLQYLHSHVGHLHLTTANWGGNELTEVSQGGAEYNLINSLRLVRLPEGGITDSGDTTIPGTQY